jgi:hypothetical protein
VLQARQVRDHILEQAGVAEGQLVVRGGSGDDFQFGQGSAEQSRVR